MRKISCTLILICCCLFAMAQDNRFEYSDSSILDENKVTETAGDYSTGEEKDILSDTLLHIQRIQISPDTIYSWKQNEKFSYMSNIDSFLKAKQQDVVTTTKPKTEPGFLEKIFASNIFQMLFWGVAIIFVLFVIFKLFLSNAFFSKNTLSRSNVKEIEEEETIASVSDYDKLIHQSVKLGDYRMAVRYLFLKTLAHLSEKEFLQWSTDKTNYQYVQEIPADKKNDFSSLVLNYEYVWYGNFAINSETFTGIEKKFSNFNGKIQ